MRAAGADSARGWTGGRAGASISGLPVRPASPDLVGREHKGVAELIAAFFAHAGKTDVHRRHALLAQRAYRLIQHRRMRNLDFAELSRELEQAAAEPGFNLYRFADQRS